MSVSLLLDKRASLSFLSNFRFLLAHFFEDIAMSLDESLGKNSRQCCLMSESLLNLKSGASASALVSESAIHLK